MINQSASKNFKLRSESFAIDFVQILGNYLPQLGLNLVDNLLLPLFRDPCDEFREELVQRPQPGDLDLDLAKLAHS